MNTVDQFKADLEAIRGCFTSIGTPANPAKDNHLFGYNKGTLAAQLGTLRRRGVPEADLLDELRKIYGAVDAEIHGGVTPRAVAEPMAEALVQGWEP